MYKYVRIMQQRVFITQETNNIQIFHTTLTKWGSAQTSLVRVDFAVYVSLTYTNGARCGDRREVPTLETRAVNIGQRGQDCFHPGRAFIQVVPLRAVMSQRREQRPNPGGKEPEGGGTPQKLPRSSQASEVSRR